MKRLGVSAVLSGGRWPHVAIKSSKCGLCSRGAEFVIAIEIGCEVKKPREASAASGGCGETLGWASRGLSSPGQFRVVCSRVSEKA